MNTRPASPGNFFRSTFLTHPRSVGETYLQHLRAALGFASSLAIAASAAMLHAFIPCLCETTARRRINALHDKLQRRVPDVTTPDTAKE